MSNAVLGELVQGLTAGNLRLVDLTETLRPEYPTIQLPPEFGQAWGFSKETISQYDEKGPAWRWSNFSMSEHTGTHLDAPAHWVTGKDLPGGTVDTMPLQQMIAPVCVIDCTAQVATDKGFILTKSFLLEWEKSHGKIPAGSWVFLRSDWRKVADPDNYTNVQADGAHSPGPDKDAVLWMIEERDVLGFGTECVGTDAGQAYRHGSALSLPPFHARARPARPAVHDQPGPAARHRCGGYRHTTEDYRRLRQPAACRGPGRRLAGNPRGRAFIQQGSPAPQTG